MADKPQPKQEIVFSYQKSPNSKNYHIDGIHGGLTARGLLNVNFFVEKHPLPSKETRIIGPKGLEPSNEPQGTPATMEIIREIEGCLIMDYNVMKATRDWLTTKIQDFEDLLVPPTQPTQKH